MENIREFKNEYDPVKFDEWPGREYANTKYFGDAEDRALLGAVRSYRNLQQQGKINLSMIRDNGSWNIYLGEELIEKHHFAIVEDL